MKCIIFGDREIVDYSILLTAIANSGFTITSVCSGKARGADTLGERFAEENSLEIHEFEAKWDDLEAEGCIVKINKWNKPYNAKAGFDRNQLMADVADCGIGLQSNGNTSGTQDMKDRLDKLGKPVYILGPKRQPQSGEGEDDRIQF